MGGLAWPSAHFVVHLLTPNLGAAIALDAIAAVFTAWHVQQLLIKTNSHPSRTMKTLRLGDIPVCFNPAAGV